MGLTSYPFEFRTWRGWMLTALVAELAWFVLIHPLVPRTLRSALILALCPVPIVVYAYLIAHAVTGLVDSRLPLRLREAVGLVLILSVGLFGFGVLWVVEAHFNNDLGYFYLHRS
jgi:hypothetical protein